MKIAALPLDGRVVARDTVRCGRRPSAREGSVLILVLWTLLFLGGLALATRSYVLGHLRLARALRDRAQSYFLACAGVETAVAIAGQDTNRWDALQEPWSLDERAFRDVRLATGSFDVRARVAHDEQAMRFGLLDEERKINLNRAGARLLAAVLVRVGRTDSLTAERISASICDWRDEDDEPLEDGAEKDYYGGRRARYECHNGPFLAVRELRLVRGMTDALFARLRVHLTVHGSGRVNVNTASETILMCLLDAVGAEEPAVRSELVGKILRFREAGGVFRSARGPELVAVLARHAALSQGERAAWQRLSQSGLVDVRSTHFGGEAVGRVEGDSPQTTRIDFVFNRRSGGLRYWHEE